MSRVKNWTDEEILEELEKYVEGLDSCHERRSSMTFDKFSGYLADKGILISSNVLRHRSAVASRFGDAKRGRPAVKVEKDSGESLEERHKKLISLVKDLFVRGVCSSILSQSGSLTYGELPELINPETLQEAVVTPKSKPFDNKIAQRLKEFYNEEKEDG